MNHKKKKNIATAMIRHSLLSHQLCYKRLSNSFTIRTECTELRIKSDVTLLSNPETTPTKSYITAPHFLLLHGFGSHSLCYMPYFSPSTMASLIFYFLSYVQPLFEINERTSAHRKLYASDISVFSLFRNATALLIKQPS